VVRPLDDVVWIYDVTRDERVQTVSAQPTHGLPFHVTLTPDGRFLAAWMTESKQVLIWDVPTGAVVHTIPILAAEPSVLRLSIRRLDFTPDGGTIALAADAGGSSKVILWGLRQHRATAVRMDSQVRSLAFSPDGRLLALGGTDRTVGLWDVETGKQMMTFRGHGHAVTGVAFAPDGKRLVSAAQDGTIKIWSLVPPDAPVAPPVNK
jgi:WD40 repeat protein